MKLISFPVCLAIAYLSGSCLTSPTSKASTNVLLCYWGSWAGYRWGDGLVDTTNIDPNTCTHLVYAFAGLDTRTNEIMSLDRWNDLGSDESGGGKDNYRNLVNLQRYNPNLKVLLAIGGWNEGSPKYSNMAKTAAKRQVFVRSVVSFMDRYGFHGLDFDWEWPGLRGGVAADKANYVELLKELRAAFGSKYLLTIAGPALPNDVNHGFNLPEISKYVDYLSVFSYDYNVAYDHYDHGSPLYGKNPSSPCVDQSIQYYLTQGFPANKLLMGVTLYGRAFRVFDPNHVDIGDRANGPADMGQFSQQAGLLAWFELCRKINEEGFHVVVDPIYQTPYAYNDYEWIAYDHQGSLDTKVSYAKKYGLAGLTAWSLENDDMNTVCGDPLVSSIKKSLDS